MPLTFLDMDPIPAPLSPTAPAALSPTTSASLGASVPLAASSPPRGSAGEAREGAARALPFPKTDAAAQQAAAAAAPAAAVAAAAATSPSPRAAQSSPRARAASWLWGGAKVGSPSTARTAAAPAAAAPPAAEAPLQLGVDVPTGANAVRRSSSFGRMIRKVSFDRGKSKEKARARHRSPPPPRVPQGLSSGALVAAQ